MRFALVTPPGSADVVAALTAAYEKQCPDKLPLIKACFPQEL